MTQQQDYYATLGLSRNASKDEVKKAYKVLALKYHPDKNPGDASAEHKFKEVAQAYEVLSNDDARRRYDQGEDVAGGPAPSSPSYARQTPPSYTSADYTYDQQRGGYDQFYDQRRDTAPHSPSYGSANRPSFDTNHQRSAQPRFVFTDPFVLFNQIFAAMDNFDRAIRHAMFDDDFGFGGMGFGTPRMLGGFGFPRLTDHYEGFDNQRAAPRRSIADQVWDPFQAHREQFAAFDRMFDDMGRNMRGMSDSAFEGAVGTGGMRSFSSHTVISNGRAKTVSVSRFTDRDGKVHEERHETDEDVPNSRQAPRRTAPLPPQPHHASVPHPQPSASRPLMKAIEPPRPTSIPVATDRHMMRSRSQAVGRRY